MSCAVRPRLPFWDNAPGRLARAALRCAPLPIHQRGCCSLIPPPTVPLPSRRGIKAHPYSWEPEQEARARKHFIRHLQSKSLHSLGSLRAGWRDGFGQERGGTGEAACPCTAARTHCCPSQEPAVKRGPGEAGPQRHRPILAGTQVGVLFPSLDRAQGAALAEFWLLVLPLLPH